MKKVILKTGVFLLAVGVLTTSCKKKDDKVDDIPVDTSVNYVMALRALDGNDESADYLLTVNDLMSGEITAEGQGEELIGWNYGGHFGNTYFSFGYDLNECTGYTIKDGYLVQKGKFVFERFDVMNPIDNNNFMAIGAPWGGGSFDCQFQVVNVNDVAIHKNVKHPIYVSYDDAGDQLNAWPTSSYIDGNKLFVSFYPLNGSSWATPNTDTAYVSIYSYPEIEYIKTIKDNRTGPIGYYAGQPCILEDENGDHYTVSSGAKSAGFSQATKPSAILKINAGDDAFDQNYFFNVETSGYKVTSAVYVGNGLAVANVISTGTDDAASAENTWALFSETTPILNTAILDLNAQTVTIVNDVPLHGGQYATPFLVEGTDVYISVNDGTEAYVYKVDATSATAKQGAKLIGNQFQGLYSGNR